jgi:hypothetical protein
MAGCMDESHEKCRYNNNEFEQNAYYIPKTK